MRESIDLNADLGEGFGAWRMGDDAAMLDVVTSANIACGFHAGDPSIMLATCRAAAERGVAIGAHVAYRDLAGFGRRDVDLAPDELYADVVYQLGALDAAARAAGTSVRYIKPHGALYNRIVHDEEQAEAVARAVRDVTRELPLLGLAGSVAHAAAERLGLRVLREAFVDRAYTHGATLVPRSVTGSVLHDPAEIARRAVRMAAEGRTVAITGESIDIEVDSLCVHGDTPGAVAMAIAVRDALGDAGIALAPVV
ncbi:LamB/YcsF family protein [Microbacteriaceae bacterium VKM Ac-2854]|nr:LamB/YcsF family protein [Microbacteriaceae bacterium VKM Ac-2854]